MCPAYQFLTATALCTPMMILHSTVWCHLHWSCTWYFTTSGISLVYKKKNVGPKCCFGNISDLNSLLYRLIYTKCVLPLPQSFLFGWALVLEWQKYVISFWHHFLMWNELSVYVRFLTQQQTERISKAQAFVQIICGDVSHLLSDAVHPIRSLSYIPSPVQRMCYFVKIINPNRHWFFPKTVVDYKSKFW